MCSPRTSTGLSGGVWPAAYRGWARPGDRELVDSVDAFDPAQLRGTVEGEVGGARGQECQSLFQFRPGQVGAQAEVRPGTEREQPRVTGRGDVELLPRVAFPVGPFGAHRHDGARREDHIAVLDLLQADPRCDL